MKGPHSARSAAFKLFDFENPSSFKAGLNEFTAPAGAFAYQNVNYWIVLSGFSGSLSIKETTSYGEDPGGETGATISDASWERPLSHTGPWKLQELTPQDSAQDRTLVQVAPATRLGVPQIAVQGSRRDRGFLLANYGQLYEGGQEIVSVGDVISFEMDLFAADRLPHPRCFVPGGRHTIRARHILHLADGRPLYQPQASVGHILA